MSRLIAARDSLAAIINESLSSNYPARKGSIINNTVDAIMANSMT